MQPNDYNQQLIQQIQQNLGLSPNLSEEMLRLFQAISNSYNEADDRIKALQEMVDHRTSQLIASTSNAYSFLDSLNMGFILCDVNPQVVLANDSVRRIFDAIRKDSNQSANSPIPEMQWDLEAIDTLQPNLELKKLVAESLKTNKPIERDDVSLGQHVMRVFIAPLINEIEKGNKQQIGAVVLFEDITEQKILDRSKDEFLSIASHELRTPLTAIRGNSSMIKKYYGEQLPDKDIVEMIDDIHDSSVRLIEIVNDFLDVSALEQGKIIMNPESFHLNEIIGEVVRELQNLCESKGIALLSKPSDESVPAVIADKQRIKQVIYNLVGNAVKFTDQGSVTISTRADDSSVYATVSDTGKGMSQESQSLLFRKFQQAGNDIITRDSTKGTGLGLYISKLIVELSGGKINLESSQVAKGSSFTFNLPIAKH